MASSIRQKKLHWHSTFGEIVVLEQILRSKRLKGIHRPFVTVAKIGCNGYSRPLQRVVIDFAADVPFARVGEKLKEHYGIDLPRSAAATLTYRHAHALEADDCVPRSPSAAVPLTLIAQADGSMIPLVCCGGPEATDGEGPPADKRKRRTLFWKEARLSLVRHPAQVTPVVAVTLSDPAACGQQIRRLACAVGLVGVTRVHGVGDGAPWIADQFERQFGAQGGYLIDFFHLCDYLAAAAPVCAPGEPAQWLETQKARMKVGELPALMAELDVHREPESTDTPTPVRDAYRYIANRPGQFDYPAAIAANLPIGSGEVESAHRYVIQKRLKLPGAWWTASNAQAMLNLRCLRANQRWADYWNKRAA